MSTNISDYILPVGTAIAVIYLGRSLLSYTQRLFTTASDSKYIDIAVKSGKTITVKDIPGLVGYPVLGALPVVYPFIKSQRIDLFFEHLLTTYGSVCKMQSGDVTSLLVDDGEVLKKILNSPDTFMRGPEFYQLMKDFVPYALFVLPDVDDTWKKHRKGLQPAFGPVHLREAFKVTVEILDQLFSIWDKEMEGNKTGITTRNAMDDFTLLTGDVIGSIAFSYHLDAVKSLETKTDLHFKDHMEKIAATVQMRGAFRGREFLHSLFGISPAQLSPSVNFIKELVMETIKTKRETLELRKKENADNWARDLLDRLLLDDKFSEEEIVSEVFGFFFAGHETTANTLTWAIMEISQRPDVAEKLKKEIDSILGENELTMENLNSFRYVDAFIKETQRFHPVVPFLGRKSKVDTVITSQNRKIAVPANTRVLVPLKRIQTAERNWGPTGGEFIPERWLKSDDSAAEFVPPPGSFLPFGDGPMNCIGQKMALIEAKVVIIRLVQKYSVKISEKQGPLVPVVTITYGLKHGLLVDLKKH
ncbi:hypothetical protein HK098_001430 [Nowakowskiella sp. JEL0407]|nr:hypothetical protein HK098_001430 [Nowakowskiella sp. JEL0407]